MVVGQFDTGVGVDVIVGWVTHMRGALITLLQ